MKTSLFRRRCRLRPSLVDVRDSNPCLQSGEANLRNLAGADRNPLNRSKLWQNPASGFSLFCSLRFRNLQRFAATCTTFLLRLRSQASSRLQSGRGRGSRLFDRPVWNPSGQFWPASCRQRIEPSQILGRAFDSIARSLLMQLALLEKTANTPV